MRSAPRTLAARAPFTCHPAACGRLAVRLVTLGGKGDGAPSWLPVLRETSPGNAHPAFLQAMQQLLHLPDSSHTRTIASIATDFVNAPALRPQLELRVRVPSGHQRPSSPIPGRQLLGALAAALQVANGVHWIPDPRGCFGQLAAGGRAGEVTVHAKLGAVGSADPVADTRSAFGCVPRRSRPGSSRLH